MKVLNNAKFERRGISLEDAAKRIRIVAMDIDGVLSDGRIGYTGNSGEEIKLFDVRDGSGLVNLRRNGFIVGCISGRRSLANEVRAAELNLDFLIQKNYHKCEALLEVASQNGVTLDECLFVGDDLIDGHTLMNCGIGVAVGDASEAILPCADLQTEHCGGRGAVREMAEWLLKTNGLWENVLKHYKIL